MTGQMTEKRGLMARMSAVMGRLERLPKNGWNDHFKYPFVTDADVSDAVRQALAAEGIAFLPSIEEVARDGNRTIAKFAFTFSCETGEVWMAKWMGEATDTQDKGFAKAATSALKYFLLKTFIISTGDEPDPDKEGPAKPAKKQAAAPAPVPPRPTASAPPPRPQPEATTQETPPAGRPYTAEVVKAGLAQKVAKGKAADGRPSEKLLTYARASLGKVTLNDDDHRHSITLYLFGKESTSNLTASECSAIVDWVGAKEPDYEPSSYAIEEAARIVRAWLIVQGQAELPLEEDDVP